ncbi:AAA family ATPase [Enterobacter hormaechei]|uniref:AAA family ATPase n=1 Tax=Enterobacter hormaechei TaxID=158836 RepID=UPI0030E7CBBB|nr:AAA family ATPase [Enterobacter hormaechei]
MLSKLKLENFKSFCSMQEIEFAPITLIFGQNSSGKSSIIQAILGLKQSLANASGTANFVSCGKNVDLGGFLGKVRTSS